MTGLDQRYNASLLRLPRRSILTGGLAMPIMAAAPRVRSDLYLCEGCEAVRERSPNGLPTFLRLAGPEEPGEPLLLTGRVLAADGSGPASGVVVYAHHTNARGLYAGGTLETEWSRRHGRLRGWVRTGADGRYTFQTIKPAPYPNRNLPAHVHLFVGEPGRPPYYIDDVVFAEEFGVTTAYLARQKLRGGSGVVRLQRGPQGGWLAVRDIRLERHPA